MNTTCCELDKFPSVTVKVAFGVPPGVNGTNNIVASARVPGGIAPQVVGRLFLVAFLAFALTYTGIL